MKPSQVAYKLRQIAGVIDKSKNPRRDLVAADLKQIVAILMSPEKMPDELEANRRFEREEKFREPEPPSPFGLKSHKLDFFVYVPDDVGGETEYEVVVEIDPAEPDVGLPEPITNVVSVTGPQGEVEVDDFMDKFGDYYEEALISALEP